MKRLVWAILLTAVALLAAAHYAETANTHMQRFGMVIGVKPDQITAYKALHAASNPGVRDILQKYNIHNFSIYLQKFPDGKYYEFAYYEYTGADFKGDMAKADADPRNQKWLSVTDKMQIPLAGERSWTKMEEVFHNP
jgi:L-rhamnose mutarotase